MISRSLTVYYLLLGFFLYDLNGKATPGIDKPDCWCRITKKNDFCIFDEIKLNRTHYHFQPKALNVSNALKIKFSNNSVIPVFGEDMCNTFTTSIRTLDLNGLKIEEIFPQAFKHCTEIRVLRLVENKIQTLDKDIFRHNRFMEELYLDYNSLQQLNVFVFSSLSKLKTLFLNSNQIRELQPGIFDSLESLKFLSMNNNSLTMLQPELFKANSKLERLEINTNNLLDLDEERLLEALPNLKGIALNENELNCVRVSEIKSTFRARGVTLYVAKSKHRRKRFYPVDEAESIMCASDISWLAASYRHTITQPWKLESVCKRALTPNWVESMATDVKDLKERVIRNEELLEELNTKLNVTMKVIYTIQRWLLGFR